MSCQTLFLVRFGIPNQRISCNHSNLLNLNTGPNNFPYVRFVLVYFNGISTPHRLSNPKI